MNKKFNIIAESCVEAECKTPPNVIAEEDALRLEKISLETDLLNAQGEALEAKLLLVRERLSDVTTRGHALGSVLRARYGITDGDIVDIAKRSIVRK